MKKFIVFGYSRVKDHDPSTEPSQEARQEIFKKWGVWQEEMGDLLVSMGSPLVNGTAVQSSGFTDDTVSDLSGYMIIKANDKNHALELLNKSPLFGMGHGQAYELFECIM